MSNCLINQQLALYFIVGTQNVQHESPLAVVEAALQGGITCFQLREKGKNSLQGDAKKQFAKACQALCRQYHVPFIVNDDVELAIEIDADGVHLGQEDAAAKEVRKRLGPNKIVGVSAHTIMEVEKAIEDGADYVGMGPVYETATKTDARAVAGTKVIEQVKQAFPHLPIVAIGGIHGQNLAPVLHAGASGVALISAIASAVDPYTATKELQRVVTEVLGGI